MFHFIVLAQWVDTKSECEMQIKLISISASNTIFTTGYIIAGGGGQSFSGYSDAFSPNIMFSIANFIKFKEENSQ